jgi:hypothetical protein
MAHARLATAAQGPGEIPRVARTFAAARIADALSDPATVQRIKLDRRHPDLNTNERFERYARDARASRVKLERSGISVAIVAIVVLVMAWIYFTSI